MSQVRRYYKGVTLSPNTCIGAVVLKLRDVYPWRYVKALQGIPEIV